jgi:hypothetical protein
MKKLLLTSCVIVFSLVGVRGLAQEQATQAVAVTPAPAAVATAEQSDEFTPPPGYQKRVRDGKEVYCRQVVPAGSRIKRNECFTRLQIEAIDQAQKAFREDLRNQGLICADQRCSGG